MDGALASLISGSHTYDLPARVPLPPLPVSSSQTTTTTTTAATTTATTIGDTEHVGAHLHPIGQCKFMDLYLVFPRAQYPRHRRQRFPLWLHRRRHRPCGYVTRHIARGRGRVRFGPTAKREKRGTQHLLAIFYCMHNLRANQARGRGARNSHGGASSPPSLKLEKQERANTMKAG